MAILKSEPIRAFRGGLATNRFVVTGQRGMRGSTRRHVTMKLERAGYSNENMNDRSLGSVMLG